jgi:hypothetical protein
MQRLPRERTHGHQQQHRVEEGGEDARTLPAVGVPVIRAEPNRKGARPGKQQSCHVAQVVGSIGQQRQRTDLPAIEGLDRDEGRVQADADAECAVEAGGRMIVLRVSVVGTHATGTSSRCSVCKTVRNLFRTTATPAPPQRSECARC